MTDPANPVVIDLARWVGAPGPDPDLPDLARLELRDTRLSEVRALLSGAEELIHRLLSQQQPALSAPSAAGELHLIADQLAHLPEGYDGAEQNPALLSRAALLCAGQKWAALHGLAVSLRARVSAVDEAIAQTAVQVARLHRSGLHLAIATSPDLRELEAEEQQVNEGLNRHVVLAGARSAFAAADAAFLPSLTDFLH